MNRRGFSLVEVMVAVVILVAGVLAYAAGAGMVSRMVGRGRMTTLASEVASSRLEEIRRVAGIRAGTPPARCAALPVGAQTDSVRGVTLAWTVPAAGRTRTVTMTVTYPVATGVSTITIETAIACD